MDAFLQRGIDVSSEGVSWFFRDVLSYGHHLWTFGDLLDALPILSVIFHGKVSYGSYHPLPYHRIGKSDAEVAAAGALQGGIWENSVKKGFAPAGSLSRQICTFFYKGWVPYRALVEREIEDYTDHPFPRMTYGRDTYVEMPTPETYRVVVDGGEIATEDHSVYRKSEDTLLAWSEKGRELPLAPHLPGRDRIYVRNLATGGKSEATASEALPLPPGQPLKISTRPRPRDQR
jgi:hypothetical protein